MRTTRGPISSHDKPEDALKKVERKPARKARAIDPEQSADGSVRFQTVVRSDGRRIRNLTIYIAKLEDDDPADDARTEAAAAALRSRKIRMRDARYSTNRPEVIAWLRGRIYNGHLPEVEEDVTMRELPCPHKSCDWTAPHRNTAEGQRELSEHLYEEHA